MLEEVRRNAFNVERDLRAYREMLGAELTDFLKTLASEAHWVDAGAGRAQAAVDYLQSEEFPAKARVTAVALNPPEDLDVAALGSRLGHTGFRYLHGRPIEEIPPEEIGPADLLTDVYGPLQYSRQIDQVLLCYARLLKPGGRLWARMPAITAVKDGDREIPLAMWLTMVKGFRAVRLPVAGLPENEVVMVRNEEAVQVPPLFLSRVVSGPPPLREYLLFGHS